jgi:hypothetical protein
MGNHTTLRLKRNYLADVKTAKNKIVGHLRCPIFPDGLWSDVLLGRFIDLDKVYSGYYALESDYHHTQTIGDIDITLYSGGSGSKPTKSVQTHGEWAIAFSRTRRAILFAYPHRADELEEYEWYVIGQFAAFSDVSQHYRILNLDRAIRLRVSQSNDLLLVSFSQFNNLVTHHLLGSAGPPRGGQGSAKRAKLAANGDVPICRRWNNGKCTSDSCRYRHLCLQCGSKHQAKDCGSGRRDGTKPSP